MDIFLQQIINGLVAGSVYALVALGYTMVYGILGLINFAHGDVVMVGAMTASVVADIAIKAGLAPPLVFVVALGSAAVVCTSLGLVMERVAYRPLRTAPILAPLITALGVSVLIQQVVMSLPFWGRNPKRVANLMPQGSYEVWGATITATQIFMVSTSVLVMVALLLLINRTRLGMAMRATAQNRNVAKLMGIATDRIIAITFGLGAALAALAGMMVSNYYGSAHYSMGFLLGLKAFSAAVLGGIGNLTGAMLGGVLLGLIESLGAGYIGDLTGGVLGSHYQDIFAFLVLVLVLLFRPGGLMGVQTGDRA